MKDNKIIFLLIALILFFECSNAQTYPKKVLADCDAHCKKEWTKRGELDKEMYDACVTWEKEGYDKMREMEGKYKKYTWLQDVKSKVIAYWTKVGITEWRMVGASLEKEIDAYLDIQYGLSHGDFKKENYDVCKSEWQESESVWSMTLYCLKNP